MLAQLAFNLRLKSGGEETSLHAVKPKGDVKAAATEAEGNSICVAISGVGYISVSDVYTLRKTEAGGPAAGRWPCSVWPRHSYTRSLGRLIRRTRACTERCICLQLVLEGLKAGHDLQQKIAIDAALGVSVGCHIPSVAPLHTVYNTTVHHLSDPAYVSRQCTLSGFFRSLLERDLKTDSVSMVEATLMTRPPSSKMFLSSSAVSGLECSSWRVTMVG